jgi:RimJ/RimL family protein N-acetyltransferase
VAFDEQKELVAFAFLKAKMRLPNDAILAELGICISDDYQSKGLGFRLIKDLLELGRKENFEMFLIVHSDNVRAKRLYEEYGFKKTLIIKNGDSWHGRKYDCILMQLQSTHSEVTKMILKFLHKSHFIFER